MIARKSSDAAMMVPMSSLTGAFIPFHACGFDGNEAKRIIVVGHLHVTEQTAAQRRQGTGN